MKKFISAVTSLAMAATMASSIAPSISAEDATKTFSLKAYAEAGSKYDAMGDKVTISKDDIAAGDVVVPCAVYLDEATNDSQTISVQFTINSANEADAKNVTFINYLPTSKYFSEEKSFKMADGTEFKTKNYCAFAGEIDDIDEIYIPAGKGVAGCEPEQSVAGATNYFIGYAWTNNGSSYKWTGAKSDEHPILVFDVKFPKGTKAGDYKIQYCRYNTDTTGEHNNPSNMIETTKRYTEDLGNLKLNEMTITVEGEGATSETTSSATTSSATTSSATTSASTTSSASTTIASTTSSTPTPSGDVIFDFGNYDDVAAGTEKLKVPIKVDTSGKPVSAMDVVFKVDSPLTITNIGKTSPAMDGEAVMTNMDILGANFTAIKEGSGEAKVPSTEDAVFTVVVNVPETTPSGTYKIGFGDKCEVFKDSSSNTYTTGVKNGNITVKGKDGGSTESTSSATTSSATTSETTSSVTTSNTTPVSGDVIFDFGVYDDVAAGTEKLKVPIKVDTSGKPVSAMDVVFKVDSPLTITNIGKTSPAMDGEAVMTNMDILGANFTAIKEGSGEAKVPSTEDAVFTVVVNVPDTTPTGSYKIGFGDKCEVFKDSSSNTYTYGVKNGIINVKGKDGGSTESTSSATTSATTSETSSSQTTSVTTGEGGTLKPVWGDVNCDGTVNVADVVLLNKYLKNNSSYAITDQGKVNADCCNPQDANGGAVNPATVDLTSADSDAIINSVVHLITLPKKA